MSEELAAKTCLPCRGGVPPLSPEEAGRLLGRLSGWGLNGKGHLEKPYPFEGFKPGLDFVRRVGEMAEEQGHHPDLYVRWGEVRVYLWTHKINGLHASDFIMAAKIDRLYNVQKAPAS